MRKSRLNNFLLRSIGVLLILATTVSSCKEDEPAPVKQKADFSTSSTTVSENAGTASTVTISFTSAITEASQLTVSLENATGVEYATHYVTNPNGTSGTITLDVASGATSASFTVTPVDDTEENDARVITMKLTAATGNLELGTATTHTFTITDNDVPASVNFKTASSTVAENAGAAHTIELELTSAAVNAGSFDVTITSDDASYTTDYTTDPDGSTGTFTVDVAAEATAASFTVTPVDNADEAPDKKITFTISNPTGGVNIGQSTSHELTITEDDNATLKTIAELRTLYGDGSADVNLNENWIIQGTVISDMGAVTSKNVVIQDATAGIVVRWDENNTFATGDNLTIRVQGTKMSNFNALVQIGGDGNMPLTNGTVDSQNNAVTPAVITFAQLNTGDYESQLVEVANVSFADADGINTVSGNNTGNDGTEDGVVRVESYAPFVDNVLPIGTGTIKGVAGTFNGTAQVLPQVAEDFFANAPTAAITTDTDVLSDFGSVETGQESALAKSFLVNGTTLNGDITVTAPDQFKVSLDNITFTSSVVIAKADAESVDGDVVNVLFTPTSGFSNVHTGDIILTSPGAITQKVAVSGTEVPVGGPTTVLFADDFDYGSTVGDLTVVSGGVWNAHSGADNGPAAYITTSLTMTGYGSSGVGGSITNDVSNSEDVNATYSEQTSGTLYGSVLANFTAATTNGDYFFHFKDASFGLYGRVYVKDDGAGNLLFGLREGSSGTASIVYGTTQFATNTTYLLVLKYDFAAGAATLYVLDNAAGTEPGTPEVTVDDANDATTLSSIAFRQGSNTPNGNFDGVRVATDWAGVIGN